MRQSIHILLKKRQNSLENLKDSTFFIENANIMQDVYKILKSTTQA